MKPVLVAALLAASPAWGQGVGAGILDDREIVGRVVEMEGARLLAAFCVEQGVSLDPAQMDRREAGFEAAVRARGRTPDEARELFALPSVVEQIDLRIDAWLESVEVGLSGAEDICAALERHLLSGGALSSLLRLR